MMVGFPAIGRLYPTPTSRKTNDPSAGFLVTLAMMVSESVVAADRIDVDSELMSPLLITGLADSTSWFHRVGCVVEGTAAVPPGI